MNGDRQARLDAAGYAEPHAAAGALEAADSEMEALRAEKADGAEVSTWQTRIGLGSSPRRDALVVERARVEELIERSYRAQRDRTGTRAERKALAAEVLALFGRTPGSVARVSRLPERPAIDQTRKAA